MLMGFYRRVEEQYIDVERTAREGKLDHEIEGSPNGYYTCIIVPRDLVGRTVVVVPLDDDDKPLDFDKFYREAREGDQEVAA